MCRTAYRDIAVSWWGAHGTHPTAQWSCLIEAQTLRTARCHFGVHGRATTVHHTRPEHATRGDSAMSAACTRCPLQDDSSEMPHERRAHRRMIARYGSLRASPFRMGCLQNRFMLSVTWTWIASRKGPSGRQRPGHENWEPAKWPTGM